MAVPYTFGTATSSIPLSQLDSNFSTAITLGNTAIQLGNTATTLNNMTLANVTIASGNVTLTNVTVTTANVTTANITTAVIVNDNVTNLVATSANVTTANVTTANITTANITNSTVSGSETSSGGTPNGVAYLNGSKVVTTGSALVFDGANLGLGVTPSAWTSYKAIQVGATGAASFASSNSSEATIFANAYLNGASFKYVNSVAASYYSQSSGSHAWAVAPSGTAGNAISFTQAMTLDASGNLLVGTTNFASSNTNSIMLQQAAGGGEV